MPYRGVCSAGGTGWACRCFEQGLLWPAITGSMKVRSSSVSRSQGRALPSVLGTTLPCEEPETRNKGSSSHVAKAVCHGNIREPLVGRLLQLLRAWFPPSPRSLSLCYMTMFRQASTRKTHGCRACWGASISANGACPAEFPDSRSQTVESLPHRAGLGQVDGRRGPCPALAG